MEVRFNRKLEEAVLIILKLLGLLIVIRIGAIIRGKTEAAVGLLNILGDIEIKDNEEEEDN